MTDQELSPPQPFCFRCGGTPTYQLSLQSKPSAKRKIVDGPFWTFCLDCFSQTPWERVLQHTIRELEDGSRDAD
jgi:hypothetical protein